MPSGDFDASVERFDRLIDWETSLTPREAFLDAVEGGEGLRVKYGADLTAPTLHIGHAVNLRVMREMQDQGHTVVFLLGGFTTQIGDPTDSLQARDAPDPEIVERAKTQFIDQVGTVLKMDDPDLIEIRDNAEWWGGPDTPGTITPSDLFGILHGVTLNQLQSRDMFRSRIAAGEPVRMSEFLYPVIQGYDSVMIESDVTVVGSDQLFNENLGRELQRRAGQAEQMIVCTKITPGLDGGPKQSKSKGNYVGIADPPEVKYDRLMHLRDDLVGTWMGVYTSFGNDEIADLEDRFGDDPLDLKKHLAHNVTAMFHGNEAADQAAEAFDRKIASKLPIDTDNILVEPGSTLRGVLMHELGYKAGNIRQFVDTGALVKVTEPLPDGSYNTLPITADDINAPIEGDTYIRIGKHRFARFTPGQA
ncbi:MAG: tyrosine--tRNA ligase [Candidatus Saccharibacteria bacterium]|nr:tyrosine--tRNA ligase [Candidatus Saccharibacteria bacterium]